MAQLSDALASARTYLNDDAGSLWTDAALIPKAREAHRELQTMLWNVGSPVVRMISDPIAVFAGQNPTIVLPSDLLVPFKIQEAAAGGTFDTAIDMTEKAFLPNVVIGPTLKYWSWRNEIIRFVGCINPRTVWIFYRKSIAIPAAAADPIGIMFGELYLGARTAAIAHGSVGNKDAYSIISQVATDNFNRVVAAHRGQQSPAVRP